MKNIFIFCLLFILSACTQMQKNHKAEKSQNYAQKDSQAVLIDSGSSKPTPAKAEDNKDRVPKLGLILGPGSVKAFAHTGVIKELVKAGINVSYIVGIEWGALVGGMYASTAKINDTEWKLYKLQEKKLHEGNWFSSNKKIITISAYKDFFQQNIGDKNIKDLEIPFACPSVSIWSGAIVWQESGSLQKAIEHCMPSPPLFKPKGPWMAALYANEEAVEFLQKKGMDVVLYVDVLGASQPLGTKDLMNEYTSALLWQELKRDIHRIKSHDAVVKVEANTLQFQLYDFNARSSLASAGEKAGLQAADILVENYNF
ncbi:MAG: hypothetical protein KDD40_01055 [Bdellovibrionales bacterium]|nr:hypothetical protein [Bdellovibrionales bacterium]